MEKKGSGWSLGELANILDGELFGPADKFVSGPAPANSPDVDGLAFAESRAFLVVAENGSVGSLLLPPQLSSKKPFIRVKNVRLAFLKLLTLATRPLPLEPGVHPTAVIHSRALIHDSARIGPFCVLQAGAIIGANVAIHPGCYVGEDCEIRSGTTLFPNVVLYQQVTVGENCIIHANAVLGADGFGFSWDGTRQIKVPQVGRIAIGNDVEIGALCAVDRATSGVTQIGDGTKLDNFVQVGHNVALGEHGVVASLVGFGGSSVVGNRFTIGGQAGTSHGATVCDDVVLAGRTGVIGDIEEPGAYGGYPQRKIGEAQRAMSIAADLPKLLRRIRKLEARIAALEAQEQK